MERETFRERLAKLLQKSRKALRLYSSMEKGGHGRAAELREIQVQEWKDANAELAQRLEQAVKSVNSRQLVCDIFKLRDYFYNGWRAAEAELHQNHKDLLSAADSGDFVKAAHVSLKLVALKARVQACQAALHELQGVIDQSKVSQPAIELSNTQIIIKGASEVTHRAKVIPLLKGAR